LWLSLAHDPTNVEARLVAQFELVYRKIPPVIRSFHRAGVKILAGTDAGAAFDFPGSDLHSELWHLVQAGLTPAEALRAATSDAAAFVGLRDSLGTVAPKKIADLVLLERNPLDDIANTSRIAAVVLRGRYYERATLDQLLAAAKEAMSAMAGQQP
jgi:imidazolonepropionase-like amidohydrolase